MGCPPLCPTSPAHQYCYSPSTLCCPSGTLSPPPRQGRLDSCASTGNIQHPVVSSSHQSIDQQWAMTSRLCNHWSSSCLEHMKSLSTTCAVPWHMFPCTRRLDCQRQEQTTFVGGTGDLLSHFLVYSSMSLTNCCNCHQKASNQIQDTQRGIHSHCHGRQNIVPSLLSMPSHLGQKCI